MANQHAIYRTLRIIDDASDPLESTPSKMFGTTDDAVVWFVDNQSSDTATVKVKDFKKKPGGQPLDPIDFLIQRVVVDPGERKMIVGQIVFVPPGSSGSTQNTKYSIEAKLGNASKVVYDPDLEIEKP